VPTWVLLNPARSPGAQHPGSRFNRLTGIAQIRLRHAGSRDARIGFPGVYSVSCPQQFDFQANCA
jgi:hypothetical protein